MTLDILEKQVDEAISKARTYAAHCHLLIEGSTLASALEFCKKEGIEPPQCSTTAKSENANRLRVSASRKLTDEKWWRSNLKTSAIRAYESDQIARGNVRNFISDNLVAYKK